MPKLPILLDLQIQLLFILNARIFKHQLLVGRMLMGLLRNFVEVVALHVFEVQALELSLLLFLDLSLHL